MILKRGTKVIGDLKDGVLYKKIIERRHLFIAKGSVPAIDAKVWNEHKDKIERIEIKTDKGRIFRISRDDFERNKEGIDYGWGLQYTVDREDWTIENEKYKVETEVEKKEKEEDLLKTLFN